MSNFRHRAGWKSSTEPLMYSPSVVDYAIAPVDIGDIALRWPVRIGDGD